MNRSFSFFGPLALLTMSATIALAAPKPASEASVPASEAAQPTVEKAAPTGSAEFQFGPIVSKDPEVRAQVKKLYIDQANLEKATQARLDELQASFAAERDADLQLVIQKEMIAAKRDLQIQSMEMGLQIAKLNGDEQRVEDYELALDHLLHPEKYMPATLDPSIAKERASRMGLE